MCLQYTCDVFVTTTKNPMQNYVSSMYKSFLDDSSCIFALRRFLRAGIYFQGKRLRRPADLERKNKEKQRKS